MDDGGEDAEQLRVAGGDHDSADCCMDGAAAPLVGRHRARHTRFVVADVSSDSGQIRSPSQGRSGRASERGDSLRDAPVRGRDRAATSFTTAALRANSQFAGTPSTAHLRRLSASGGDRSTQQVLVSCADRFHPAHWAADGTASATDTKVWCCACCTVHAERCSSCRVAHRPKDRVWPRAQDMQHA